MNEWHICQITALVLFFSLINTEVSELFYQVAWMLCKQPNKKWAIFYCVNRHETTKHHTWTLSTQKILCASIIRPYLSQVRSYIAHLSHNVSIKKGSQMHHSASLSICIHDPHLSVSVSHFFLQSLEVM